MRIRKKIYLAASFVGALILLPFLLISLSELNLWLGFPEINSEDVKAIQEIHGVGRDCSGVVPDHNIFGTYTPTTQELHSCVANSNLHRIIDRGGRLGNESAMHIYRCETDNFAVEIFYLFYSTKDYYMCGKKIADEWGEIPHYKLGEIAGMQFDEVSYLTKALIWLFK